MGRLATPLRNQTHSRPPIAARVATLPPRRRRRPGPAPPLARPPNVAPRCPPRSPRDPGQPLPWPTSRTLLLGPRDGRGGLGGAPERWRRGRRGAGYTPVEMTIPFAFGPRLDVSGAATGNLTTPVCPSSSVQLWPPTTSALTPDRVQARATLGPLAAPSASSPPEQRGCQT